MSVDLRTRVDGPHEAITPDRFFGDDLPAALDAHADAVAGAAWLAPRPLTVEVAGEAWTLSVEDDGRVEVTAGRRDGAAHVRLTAEQVDGIAADQQTFVGMWTSGKLDQPAGRLEDAMDWWLVLRAALDGTPIHTPGAITLEDRDGRHLDVHRAFTLDDDPEDLRHFLARSRLPPPHRRVRRGRDGRGLPRDGRRRTLLLRRRPALVVGDRQHRATRKLVRMQAFDEKSPATAALVADPRFQSLGGIPGADHAWGARSDNRIEALFKPIGIVAGISDVPVAQGLQPRPPLLRVLQPHRRRVGDGRRRRERPAARPCRLAPRARVAVVRAAAVRPPLRRPPDAHRRRDRPPQLHAAHGAAADRAGAPGHVQQLLAARARPRGRRRGPRRAAGGAGGRAGHRVAAAERARVTRRAVAVTHTPAYDPRSVAVRQLTAAVRARAEQIEAARRLPPYLARAMAEAGLFRMCVPSVFGGREAEPTALLETIESMATADGAAGWCLMIGSTTGLLAGFLPDDVARAIYENPLAITGGVFAPKGTATVVDGGYRVTGRWPFASGCQHCDWLTGGCHRRRRQRAPAPLLPPIRRADRRHLDGVRPARHRQPRHHRHRRVRARRPRGHARRHPADAAGPALPLPRLRAARAGRGRRSRSGSPAPRSTSSPASRTRRPRRTPPGAWASAARRRRRSARATAALHAARSGLFTAVEDAWVAGHVPARRRHRPAGGAAARGHAHDPHRSRGRGRDVRARRQHVDLREQPAATALPRHPRRHPARDGGAGHATSSPAGCSSASPPTPRCSDAGELRGHPGRAHRSGAQAHHRQPPQRPQRRRRAAPPRARAPHGGAPARA